MNSLPALFLYRSFMASFFSELICCSSEIIPLPLKKAVYYFMTNFLQTADHKGMQKCSVQQGIMYSNSDLVLPLSLSYSPLVPTTYYTPANNRIMTELKQLCIEFGVLHTHCILSDTYTKNSLLKSELLNYIVCLPWVLADGSEAQRRAQALVASLAEEMELQPPPLLTLSRAKLAKIHFGLKKAMTMSVQEMVAECYN